MGRINLRPQAPALDARELDALIEVWLADCRSRLPAATADGYAYKIAYFREWWAQEGPGRAWQLRESDLVEFERALRGRQSRHGEALSYHSRDDVLRRLSAMFRWAYRAGYTETADYSAWVPEAEGQPPVRKAPGLAELGRLFEAAGRLGNAARDRALARHDVRANTERSRRSGLGDDPSLSRCTAAG